MIEFNYFHLSDENTYKSNIILPIRQHTRMQVSTGTPSFVSIYIPLPLE